MLQHNNTNTVSYTDTIELEYYNASTTSQNFTCIK